MGSGGRSCCSASPPAIPWRERPSSNEVNNLKPISVPDAGLHPLATRQNGAVVFDSDAVALQAEVEKQVGENGAGSKRELARLAIQRDLKWHIVEAISSAERSAASTYPFTRMS